jgi:hypothetical protein
VREGEVGMRTFITICGGGCGVASSSSSIVVVVCCRPSFPAYHCLLPTIVSCCPSLIKSNVGCHLVMCRDSRLGTTWLAWWLLVEEAHHKLVTLACSTCT